MEYTHFADDKEKMVDFKNLTKEEFLFSYSYLTEEEYDLTVEYLKALEEVEEVIKHYDEGCRKWERLFAKKRNKL